MPEDTSFLYKRGYDTAFPPTDHLDSDEAGSSYSKRHRHSEEVEAQDEAQGNASGVGSGFPATDNWMPYGLSEALNRDLQQFADGLPEQVDLQSHLGSRAFVYPQGEDGVYQGYTLHSPDSSDCSNLQTFSSGATYDPHPTQDTMAPEGSGGIAISSYSESDPGTLSASGSLLTPGTMDYQYEVAPQYNHVGHPIPTNVESDSDAYASTDGNVNEPHTIAYAAGDYPQTQWANYSTSVPGPSTSNYYDHHIFDNVQHSPISPTATTYFSDPTTSSLYYFDRHPPHTQANRTIISPDASDTYPTATAPDTIGAIPVADMQTHEMSMASVQEALPDSVVSFIFNASTQEQFEGNANMESARQRVGLDGDSTLPGMKVPLLPHQITGVAWMLEKEESQYKGGCLGDEMGLGKTVQMISLIVKNRSSDPSRKTNLVLAPTSLLDQWKQELEIKTDCGLTCLIYHGSRRVKHANQLSQYDVVLTTYTTMSYEWADPDGPERGNIAHDDVAIPVEIQTGRRRRVEAGPLFQVEFYRIVLDEAQSIRNKSTVVSRAVNDLNAVYRWCLTGTPIINTLVDAYGYLRFLKISPWCKFHEFQRHVGKEEKRAPNLASKRLQVILNPIILRRKKDSTLDGKRLIELPEKTIDLVKLEFSQEERDIYNMVEARTQAKFNSFLRAGTVLKNYHQVLVLLLRLRQICSHPSLIQEEGMMSFNYGYSGGSAGELVRATNLVSREFVEKVQRKFREIYNTRALAEKESPDASIEHDECPICFDTLTDSVITACTHIFCRDCISEAIDHSNAYYPEPGQRKVTYGIKERPCPVCREPISKEKLFSCTAFEPQDESDSVTNETSGSSDGNQTGMTSQNDVESKLDSWSNNSRCPPLSAKMKYTMEQLKKLINERPEEKVLIISQWTSCLSLISKYLQEANIEHVRYQGEMDRAQRSQSVKNFTWNGEIRVMLMSLKCGGVGLNLTRANHVISLDLGWSQAVEAQAFDRVHRLGQNRPVTVQRLAIANTVEDRVLKMQERKQALTDGSLGEGTGKKIKFSVRELANLFGLDQYGHRLNGV